MTMPSASRYSDYTIATRCRLGRVGIVKVDYARGQLHCMNAISLVVGTSWVVLGGWGQST